MVRCTLQPSFKHMVLQKYIKFYNLVLNQTSIHSQYCKHLEKSLHSIPLLLYIGLLNAIQLRNKHYILICTKQHSCTDEGKRHVTDDKVMFILTLFYLWKFMYVQMQCNFFYNNMLRVTKIIEYKKSSTKQKNSKYNKIVLCILLQIGITYSD